MIDRSRRPISFGLERGYVYVEGKLSEAKCEVEQIYHR